MKKIDRFIEQCISDGHFPHATLLVACDNNILKHQSYGRAKLDSVYDLASLTKPLATTAVIMQLVAQKKIKLDMSLAELIPSLRENPVGKLCLSDLLTHSSGLTAWRPFYEMVKNLPTQKQRNAIRRLLAKESLEYKTGKKTVYSDLGFMLLDWALERRTQRRLDRLAHQLIYKPLGLKRTGFVPLNKKESFENWSFVPTERCLWRKHRLLGEVHDDNCYAMGGVSGHAGLFSCAQEIHLIVKDLVSAYKGNNSIFSTKVVQTFLDWPKTQRALGWDRPTKKQSSAGKLWGANTVGHLGFTGTSLWIDLDQTIWVIFLTNRVYKGREPNPMIKVRPKLHDMILRSIDI